MRNNYPQLTVLSDENEIKEAQEKLFKILTGRADKIVHGRVGFPGGSVAGKIYWISDLHFWYFNEYVDKSKSWYDPRLGKSRYWNAFGVNEPREDESNHILCEINSPPKGINRWVGGAFAKDPMGKYYLIHRGKLGGYGGYRKKDFIENYRGEWTTVIDGDRKTDVVVIGPLDDTLPEKIKDFLYEIKRIRSSKPVLRVIASKEEIKRAQEKLFKILKNRATEIVDPSSINFTWPKANEAYWISDLGMWYINRLREGHHKNDFGTNEPGTFGKPVICEINIPVKGIDRRVGGAFAKDSNGNYYLVHRGNIRGLRLTREVYKGEWITVMDGDRESEVIFIGRLDDSLPEKIRDFVYETQKIKTSRYYGSFYEFVEFRGFYFDSEVVENFLLSLKVKPFVILTGNSGTGKTKLAQLYGEYISDSEKRYLMVPVGANWTEKRHIFGYLNIMTGEYQSTPALDFIMKAAEDPDNPYLLILDEMNLSHVERYFSDFLSAIESGEPIPLHDDPDCNFPRKIKIPRNLIVVGTVNVDETTYMFSPKVLDRANTIEFNTINPQNYLKNQPRQKPKGDLEFLEDPLNHKTELNKIKDELAPIMDQLISELEFFYEELKDPGFDFGFRVVNEILSFMHAAWIYEGKPQEWDNWKRYFDAQIKQKILPKIHGPERLLRDTLQKLKEHCTGKFPESEKKLEEMEQTLKVQRYVSFIK